MGSGPERAGFVWNLLEAEREKRVAELLAIKKEHGNCNVSQRYKPNPALGWWVCSMRESGKKGRPAADREERLERAGFVWNLLEAEWEKRFAELLAFKKEHGKCNVSRRYEPNPALGMWVRRMRKSRKAAQLAADREERLERAGFVWDLPEAGWEERFAELLAFKTEHGNCNVLSR